MARSSNSDVLDKFRFQVVFFDLNFGAFGFNVSQGALDDAFQGGFSEISLPKTTTKERLYRENISPTFYTKAAGLTTFDPVVFRKGKIIENRAFYNWQDKLLNSAAFIGPITTVISDQGAIPIYDPEYRKDISIITVDRSGAVKKAIFLFNAFPTRYDAGDLNATDESKLIEEISVSYENFVELNSDQLDELNGAIERAAGVQLAAAALALALG